MKGNSKDSCVSSMKGINFSCLTTTCLLIISLDLILQHRLQIIPIETLRKCISKLCSIYSALDRMISICTFPPVAYQVHTAYLHCPEDITKQIIPHVLHHWYNCSQIQLRRYEESIHRIANVCGHIYSEEDP